jgi:hypothetical protein
MILFSYFIRNKLNPSKTPHISFIMLNANNDNSIATTKLTSIELSIIDEIPNSFLNYKLMIINIYNASKNNPWLGNWFIIQALTIREKTSTII